MIERWVYKLELENMPYRPWRIAAVVLRLLMFSHEYQGIPLIKLYFLLKGVPSFALKQTLVTVWHSTLGTRTHVTFPSIKLNTESSDNLECLGGSPGMGEQGTHRCAVDCRDKSELEGFRVFGDCTEAEIKVVKAPCSRSFITAVHPDLEEAGVCLLIRRYNLPPTRQLSRDAPINLPEKSFKGSVESVKTVSRLNVPWKQFITQPSTKSAQCERFRQLLNSLCLPSRQ